MGHTADNTGPLFTSQFQIKNGAYFCDGENLYRVKTANLIVRETIDLSNYADVGTGLEAFGYGAIERALWICRDDTPHLSKLPLNRFDRGANNLDDTVLDLCLRAGLEAVDIDVTALSGLTVQGFSVPDRVPAKDPLEFLLTAYQIGVREHYENGYGSDGIKLEFVLRSEGSSVVSIPEEDLGIGDGEPEEQPLQEEKVNEGDLPQRVNVRYADVRRNYDSGVQKDSIPKNITSAEREFNLDFLDLVLTDDQAKQLADSILATAWAEDRNVFFTVPLQYLQLEPEDVITVTYSGVGYILRVETVELGANYILEISAVVTDVSTYVSEATGSEAPQSETSVNVPTLSQFVLVDCPCVRDQDGMPEDAGFYGFAAPQQQDATWGCRVVRSKDGGIVYGSIATFTSASTLGITATALNDGEANSFDEGSEVAVRMLSGNFGAETKESLYADGFLNLCAIGSEENGWEIVQFAQCTVNGDGTVSLAGMIRGRFGTEQYMGTHTAGEMVCQFDFTNGGTRRIPLPLSDRGLESLYKARTFGALFGSTPARPFMNQARSLMPYAVRPELISWAHDEPATNDWTLLWIRRDRLGHEVQDYFDLAVNEEAEEYEIEIRDNPSSAVLRTITVGPGLPQTVGINLAVASTVTVSRGFGTGSFLDDGFMVGQYVDLDGFSNTANNKRWKITALSGGVMTLDGPNALVVEGSAAGRTIRAATPAFCYTEAQQIADSGGSPKSSFYATFYQISQRLRTQDGHGRGFATQVQIS